MDLRDDEVFPSNFHTKFIFFGSPGCVCFVPTCCISSVDDSLVHCFTFGRGSMSLSYELPIIMGN